MYKIVYLSQEDLQIARTKHCIFVDKTKMLISMWLELWVFKFHFCLPSKQKLFFNYYSKWPKSLFL